MKEGYKVLPTLGIGCFIEVYNFEGSNQIGQYRFRIQPKEHYDSIVGIWKQKIKNEQ